MFKIQLSGTKYNRGFVRDYHIGKFYIVVALVPSQHTGNGYARFTFKVVSYL